MPMDQQFDVNAVDYLKCYLTSKKVILMEEGWTGSDSCDFGTVSLMESWRGRVKSAVFVSVT